VAINPARPEKTISAEFYQTEAGGEPVRDFLRKALTADERKAVGKDIRIVEYGWPIGMPVCKDLKNGLYEVRTDFSNRICRILFGIYGPRMIPFHGFIKESGETPKVDMDTALDRQRTMEQRR
jgi:phage-related protein